MNKNFNTKQLVLLGLLTAIVVVLTCFNVPVGPLKISMAVIPVAIAAIALGPIGGAVIGAVWGVCSFLQCFGLLGGSDMGIFTAQISPTLSFIQRFVPRVLEGFLAGWAFRLVSKLTHPKLSCFITGFATAFLNTVLFMSALVLLFGNNQEFIDTYMGNKTGIAFIIGSIGVNAIVEMIAATLVAGSVGFALIQAKLIELPDKYKKSKSVAA